MNVNKSLKKTNWKQYYNNKMLTIWLFGFTSGFALLISGNTLNFRLAESGVSKINIGLFSFVAIPYAINFLWAPIIDSIKIPYISNKLGKRRGWLILLQALLSVCCLLLSFLDPREQFYSLAIIAFIASIFSSSQDITLSAIRSEILSTKDTGMGSAIYSFGYRIGMLFGSSGAISVSVLFDWSVIYQFFAVFVLFLSSTIFWLTRSYKESEHIPLDVLEGSKLVKLKSIIIKITRSMGSMRSILILIIFLILYRFADNFIVAMINPFLLDMGFKTLEIASIGKMLGIISAILGGIIAGSIMQHQTIKKSLLIFGAMHSLAHMLFIIQALIGYNYYVLAIVMGFESFTSGMTMTAYITLITLYCKGKYRATQYSFLSASMGLSRASFPAVSGFIVVKYGWVVFFALVSILSLPALIILYYYFDENLQKFHH